MKKTGFNFLFLLLPATMLITGCGKTSEHQEPTSFTKADSLTERFLELHDSTLATWNTLISDENEKFHAMHELIHELLLSSQADKEKLIALENRMNLLSEMKLTAGSIDNPSLVEEYDFTTSAILTELITLGESNEQFAENKTLRRLVDKIKLTDQLMEGNRTNYDVIVNEYNEFISRNRSVLHEIHVDSEISVKPLFQETSLD